MPTYRQSFLPCILLAIAVFISCVVLAPTCASKDAAPSARSSSPSLSPAQVKSVSIPDSSFVPPSGVMAVVVLAGNAYEMGYEYGLQVPEYIAIVRDFAWASALSMHSREEVEENCSIYRRYIRSELPEFDFLDFFRGISDAMNLQGFPFSEEDPIVMLYYSKENTPKAPDHCTAFMVYDNSTPRRMIGSVNFDFYTVPANSYAVVLAIYPEDGYSCLLPAGAGRTGSNSVVNERGLVYFVTASPARGPGDTGPGTIGYLDLAYVGMRAQSVSEAEGIIVNTTEVFGLNHLIADQSGRAEVIESTRARQAIRRMGDNREKGYLIATNHYLNQSMKPSQPIWDPREYYPSSYYRYITAEKQIAATKKGLNYTSIRDILSSTDWWDGREWHYSDPWGGNSINRFEKDFATLYSLIAIPADHVVSICSGNPGMPYWGTLASNETGIYINYSLRDTPEAMVQELKSTARTAMWRTVPLLANSPPDRAISRWAEVEDRYSEGIWCLDRAMLEDDQTARVVELGRSATAFSKVIAIAGEIQKICQDSRGS
jgi:hypothetical protein